SETPIESVGALLRIHYLQLCKPPLLRSNAIPLPNAGAVADTPVAFDTDRRLRSRQVAQMSLASPAPGTQIVRGRSAECSIQRMTGHVGGAHLAHCRRHLKPASSLVEGLSRAV